MRRTSTVVFILALASLGGPGCIIVDDPEPSDESGSAEGGSGIADGTGSGACFEDPQCDPLSPSCAEGKCAPSDGAFGCVPVTPGQQEAGEGEPCSGAASCQEGLVCLAGGTCADGGNCCVPLCDVAQPQCGGGTCTPYFGETSPPCYEDVGVCVTS